MSCWSPPPPSRSQVQSLTYYLYKGSTTSSRLSALMPALSSATLRDFPALTDPLPLTGCTGWDTLLDSAEQPAGGRDAGGAGKSGCNVGAGSGAAGGSHQHNSGQCAQVSPFTALHPGSVASRWLPEAYLPGLADGRSGSECLYQWYGSSYQVGGYSSGSTSTGLYCLLL
jgi:hypothetical protein